MSFQVDIELNWEKDCKLKNWQCDRCDKHAVVECEVNQVKGPERGSIYGVYCKDHRETLLEDIVHDIETPDAPDFDDLED